MRIKPPDRTGLLAIAVYVALTICLVGVHEAGHAAVCTGYGGTADVEFDLLEPHGSRVVCGNLFDAQCTGACRVQLDWYRFAGGGLAAVAAGMGLAVPQVRARVWLYAPFCGLAAGQAANALAEVLAFWQYIAGGFDFAIMMASFTVMMVLLLRDRLCHQKALRS